MNGRTGRGRPIPRGPGVAAFLVSLVSALVVVGPGLRPGYLLVRDMVFVPSPPLTGRLLGLGHENPRAVPSDLVVALLSHILPGDLVQKLVLVAILVAVGVGAARLAPRHPLAGSAAALVAIWNPYVGERLAMGQWALLVGYAALPWAIRSVVDLGRGDRCSRRRVVAALAVGSLGGALAWLLLTLAVLVVLSRLAISTGRPWVMLRRAGWVLALDAVLALPWAVPAIARPYPLTSDPTGFEVFRAGADTPWGAVVSVVTGGGSWNTEVVPAGRDTVVGVVGAVVLLGWGLAGYVLTRRQEAPDPAAAYRAPILWTGAVGLVVALVAVWPAALSPLAALPGGGLLRDGSRQLGLWVLAVAVGAGWGAVWLRERALPALTPWLVAALPVAVLPALGWGLAGALHPVAYPADVLAGRALLDAQARPGSVAVLPFQTYRRYPWNGGRPSLTPWPRLLDRRVVAASDLTVSTPEGRVTVAGEDGYAQEVAAALAGPQPATALGRIGVGWVVVDVRGAGVPAGVTLVSAGPTVAVYRVDAPVEATWPARLDPPILPVGCADVLWAAVVAGGVAIPPRRRTPVGGSGREASTIG